MRLLVTDEVNREVSFDTVLMTASEFNCINAHPYIATTNFDAIVLDLRCKIDLTYLQFLFKKTRVIPMVYDNMTSNSVSVLCELFKDRAAEIRITYMRDKEKFKQLVESMKSEYEWNKFY